MARKQALFHVPWPSMPQSLTWEESGTMGMVNTRVCGPSRAIFLVSSQDCAGRKREAVRGGQLSQSLLPHSSLAHVSATPSHCPEPLHP